MYTFFTDKSEVFECKISLYGAKLTESKARLVLESNDMNFIFYGKISSDGTCSVPVKKLKNYIGENAQGSVKLEVIAEDTFFEPWSDTFEIKTSKKVTVEVKGASELENSEKKMIVSEVKTTNTSKETTKKIQTLSEEFYKLLIKNKVTMYNLKENTILLNKLGQSILQKYNLTESERTQLIEEVIIKLIK